MAHRIALVPIVALVALLATSCGDSTPTKAEFVDHMVSLAPYEGDQMVQYKVQLNCIYQQLEGSDDLSALMGFNKGDTFPADLSARVSKKIAVCAKAAASSTTAPTTTAAPTN